MKKHHFRSGIKIFALGAFTGYPVLPGVSAPLSDGDREYREKQMIVAMVAHSSSEHQLQTQSDCGRCMHAWSFSFFSARTNICLPVLEPWKFKFLIYKVVQGLCTVAVHGPNTCPTWKGFIWKRPCRLLTTLLIKNFNFPVSNHDKTLCL